MIIKPYASIGKLLLLLWDAFDNVGKNYIFKCIYANLPYQIPKINKYITKFFTFFNYNCWHYFGTFLLVLRIRWSQTLLAVQEAPKRFVLWTRHSRHVCESESVFHFSCSSPCILVLALQLELSVCEGGRRGGGGWTLPCLTFTHGMSTSCSLCTSKSSNQPEEERRQNGHTVAA